MNRAYISYICALLLFGGNGIVASYIDMKSYAIVFYRSLVGAVVLLALFFLMGRKSAPRPTRKGLLLLAAAGIAMGLSGLFLYEAYAQVGVSLATLAYYCGPVLVMAASPLLLREGLTGKILFSFAVVAVGMILVNGNDLRTDGLSWGLICGLLSAVLYCVMILCNKMSGIGGLGNAAGQLVGGFLSVAAYTLLRDGAVPVPPMSSVPALVWLSLIHTAIGSWLYFSAIPRLSAQSVALVGYLEPLAALLFSALLLSERLSAVQLVGAALILGGAVFGVYTPKKWPETDA
jgi:drug/metabolite transporter (DMT)-like permease